MQEKGYGKRKSDGKQVFPGVTWNEENRQVEIDLRAGGEWPDSAAPLDRPLPLDASDFG